MYTAMKRAMKIDEGVKLGGICPCYIDLDTASRSVL
jgi:hypothetical protein